MFPLLTGTVYLWIFWPSFSSATTAHDNTEPWAVLNTYFSLAASTLATFVLSPVLYEESTPRMVGPLLRQTQVSCTAHGLCHGDGEHEHTQGTRDCPLGFPGFVKSQSDPK